MLGSGENRVTDTSQSSDSRLRLMLRAVGEFDRPRKYQLSLQAVLQGFGNMRRLDRGATIQVGNRAGYF